jgi:hypothetical protein
MNTYTEQWQEALDELEDQSSLLQVRQPMREFAWFSLWTKGRNCKFS